MSKETRKAILIFTIAFIGIYAASLIIPNPGTSNPSTT